MAGGKNHKAIVIGSSAGGLSALSCIMEKLPSGYSMPVIIVQHRSRDQRDLLEEVLQTKCKVKVKQADEKEKIKGGVIYIAPADYHLLIERDFTFSLSADEPVHYSRPSIDVLFESAALAYKSGLTAIILTGANNDGASGISAVRKYGGVAIAQDPGEAQYPVMPAAAIETKKINQVLTLLQIQNFLLKLNSYE